MKLSGKIKLLSSICACVLVSIQFQVGSAGFLHHDPDYDFHSLLRGGSNTPVYSVYSRHLSQPYFYSTPSTTAAPKPKTLPISAYRSNTPNPIVGYVLLQSNDFVRNLPFLPDVPDTENKPNKSKGKNKKKKTMEVEEESEAESQEKDNEGSGEDASDDKENNASGESAEENTRTSTNKSPQQKNSRKNSNSRLTKGSRSGAGSKKKDDNEKNEDKDSRESSESGEENFTASRSKSPSRNNPRKNSSSRPTSGNRSGAKIRNNTPTQRQTKQSSKNRPRNSRLRKNGRLLGSSSAVIPTSEINDAPDNVGEPVSSPKASEQGNGQLSPQSASPVENNSAPNGQELRNTFEEFSPSGNEIPSRERIDEAIKILSSVANQISQFNTNPGAFGAVTTQQNQPGNINFDMFSNNNAGRSNNANFQQYGAPIDIQRANNIANSFSNGEGNGNGNNFSPQYGAPQGTVFRNSNIGQQSQREAQNFVRNTNGEAYGPPSQQPSQTQAAESSADTDSDTDTASTVNLPYNQALRNVASDSSNSESSNFEIIRSVAKMY